mmetsp:Transcript_10829/g.24785  ORF Transcript_10829/g.24785 Transcript_10829/m.24785 type:complete len:930 (-) Transcript_10829:75-2864(-)
MGNTAVACCSAGHGAINSHAIGDIVADSLNKRRPSCQLDAIPSSTLLLTGRMPDQLGYDAPVLRARSPKVDGGDDPSLDGEKLLLLAAKHGQAAAVSAAVMAGVDVNTVDMSEADRACCGATPLILASRFGHEDIVAALLACPELNLQAVTMNLDNSSRSKQNALMWASREGHASVVALLVEDPRCDVNAATQGSFTAFMIATQGGHVDVMRQLLHKVDPVYTPMQSTRYIGQPGANAMCFAILEGHAAAVRVLLEEGGIDPEVVRVTPAGRMTPLAYAVTKNQVDCIPALLQARGDPNTTVEGTSQTAFDIAYDNHFTEAMMHMMLHDCDTSKVFSKTKHAQLTSDIPVLVEMAKSSQFIPEAEMPRLHRAVLCGDSSNLAWEVSQLAKPWSHMRVGDGGHMPALFYAIELGNPAILRIVLSEIHGFPTGIVDAVVKTVLETDGSAVGQRTFKVIMLLISTDVLQEESCCHGFEAFLSPWMGSLVAVRLLQEHPEEYDRLRDLCCVRRETMITRIDREVPRHAAEQLVNLGLDEPSGPALRQDMPGLLPTFRYFWNESDKRTMGGDHEHYLVGSLALLGTALEATFKHDMLELFARIPGASLHTTAAKPGSRMLDKLRNPSDHGRPDLPKPRPALNVDVLRCAVEATSPLAMNKAFDALQRRFRILRTHNHYNSSPVDSGGCGGSRCVLVHFAYEPKVTFKQVFGDTVVHSPCEKWTMHDSAGRAWFDFASSMAPKENWRVALQGLCHTARCQPDAEIVIAAEVKLIYSPYLVGRRLTSLLQKIQRCETGPTELMRICARDLITPDEHHKRCLQDVKALAFNLRRGGQDGAVLPPPFTYSFGVARGNGKNVGISYTMREEDLLITSIHAGGAMQDFNDAEVDLQRKVREGDRIVEVCGCRDPHQMLSFLATASKLDLTVERARPLPML